VAEEALKVLSNEMDSVKIRHIRWIFVKGICSSGGFLEKSARPPSSESPLKYGSTSYFSIVNYAINLDSCGEYSLRTWSTSGHLKKKKLRRFFNTIAQFTNAHSIHSAFTSKE
jgi:hypothetical protein